MGMCTCKFLVTLWCCIPVTHMQAYLEAFNEWQELSNSEVLVFSFLLQINRVHDSYNNHSFRMKYKFLAFPCRASRKHLKTWLKWLDYPRGAWCSSCLSSYCPSFSGERFISLHNELLRNILWRQYTTIRRRFDLEFSALWIHCSQVWNVQRRVIENKG